VAVYATSNVPPLSSSAAAAFPALGGSMGLIAGASRRFTARRQGTVGRAVVRGGRTVGAGRFAMPMWSRSGCLRACEQHADEPLTTIDEVTNTRLALGAGMGALYGALTGVPLIRMDKRLG
jgi:hypothetical protein